MTMITFKEYIAEGRDAPLYHGVFMNNLSHIDAALKNNVLKAVGDHRYFGQWVGKKMDKMFGTSMSRLMKFSVTWAGKVGVTVEFNQRSLAQTNRIVPFSFFTAGKSGTTGSRLQYDAANAKDEVNFADESFPHGFNNQFEENVLGDIKNLDRHIIRILVRDDKAIESLKKRKLDNILKHPKLYNLEKKEFVNQ